MKNGAFASRAIMSAALVSLAIGANGGALAQTAKADARADGSEAGVADLDEIVVTAQRRDELLRDVAMSVTALTALSLEKAGVDDTKDLGRLVPGLTIAFYSFSMSPTLRGITGTGGNLHSTSSVPVYLDGVFHPSQIATVMTLPDVEQIEVLKGPQGTLYGQGATGGAIIIKTLAPSFTPTGKFSASYGNYNATNLRGFVSGPLNDSVAFSLAGEYLDRDAFRSNFVTGEKGGPLESRTVRGKVLFELNDSVQLTLDGHYMSYKDSSYLDYIALNDSAAGYALVPTGPKGPGPGQFGSDPKSFIQSKEYGGGARLDVDTSAGKLNVLAAYLHTNSASYQDQDASPVNYNLYTGDDWPSRHYEGTIDFASEKFGSFAFNAGAFYLNTINTTNGGRYILLGTGTTVLPSAPGAPSFISNNYTRGEKQVAAVYVEGQYEVTDRLHVTAGGRYNRESLRFFQKSFPTLTPATPIVLNEYPGGKVHFSQFSPRGTIRYEVTPTSNVYASVTRGFKGGGFNVTNSALPPYKPETITAYEVGFKGRPTEALTVGLATFWYDYKDMQILAYNNGVTIEKNAASSRSRGVELEASWQVTRAFALLGNLAYLDAKFVKFPGAQLFFPKADGTGNTSVSNGDLSGAPMLRSPKWSGNGSADLKVETTAGTFGAFATLEFSSSFGLEPTGLVRSGSFVRLDGSLSFAPAAVRGLRLIAWGKNLTNTTYLVTANVSNLASAVVPNDPRTFGMRAEYSF